MRYKTPLEVIAEGTVAPGVTSVDNRITISL
jgi:hypothetical protein